MLLVGCSGAEAVGGAAPFWCLQVVLRVLLTGGFWTEIFRGFQRKNAPGFPPGVVEEAQKPRGRRKGLQGTAQASLVLVFGASSECLWWRLCRAVKHPEGVWGKSPAAVYKTVRGFAVFLCVWFLGSCEKQKVKPSQEAEGAFWDSELGGIRVLMIGWTG